MVRCPEEGSWWGLVHALEEPVAGTEQVVAVRMNTRVFHLAPALLSPTSQIELLAIPQHPDSLHFVTILFRINYYPSLCPTFATHAYYLRPS